MSQKNEWLFDAMWELSDKALEAGMPVLADKLEEAMDTFLSEHGGETDPVVQSPQKDILVTDTKPARVAAQLIRQMVAQQEFANLWAQPESEPGFVSSRAVAVS